MNPRVSLKSALTQWPGRRWQAAAVAAVATYVVVAVPTDLIDTPFFSREIPPTWWSFPVLAVTAVLTGLLLATYVSRDPASTDESGHEPGRKGRFGAAGAIFSFFAVGCPVCNKLVLVALGTSGAMQYFEPIQPLLAALSIALLLWAFVKRATSEDRCPLPRRQAAVAAAADEGKQVSP